MASGSARTRNARPNLAFRHALGSRSLYLNAGPPTPLRQAWFWFSNFRSLGPILEIAVQTNDRQSRPALAIWRISPPHPLLGRRGRKASVHDDESCQSRFVRHTGRVAVPRGDLP